jgi:hypothetical protein
MRPGVLGLENTVMYYPGLAPGDMRDKGGLRMTLQPQSGYIITEEELQRYENFCTISLKIQSANIRSRHYSNQQSEQELHNKIAEALKDFDLWFSARHVCGQSPIIPEVRRELHKRMRELRTSKQAGEQG